MKMSKLKLTGIVGSLITASYIGFSIMEADRKYERLFEEGKREIVGTVLGESYATVLSLDSEGNEVKYTEKTVKFDNLYVLKIRTDEGKIMAISIFDEDDFRNIEARIPITKESLDDKINVGDRISFPAGNMKHSDLFFNSTDRKYLNETYFTPQVRAGNKRADRIRVL
ncbi:MAG: hypothetical protein KC550_05520 [Nanoarchaeota archaeon]|nr:hypothetical protein [Nanoarchaeota archaeon]